MGCRPMRRGPWSRPRAPWRIARRRITRWGRRRWRSISRRSHVRSARAPPR